MVFEVYLFSQGVVDYFTIWSNVTFIAILDTDVHVNEMFGDEGRDLFREVFCGNVSGQAMVQVINFFYQSCVFFVFFQHLAMLRMITISLKEMLMEMLMRMLMKMIKVILIKM